jgi:PhnB protein
MNTAYSLNPYLFFAGRCAEAIEFYKSAIGAEPLMVMRYKDAPPDAGIPPKDFAEVANRIMHARLQVGDSTVMLSDGPCSGHYDGFALSLTTNSLADAERWFAALSADGQVNMPMGKTFFSPGYGMLTDRFGVKWMVYVPGTPP